MPGLRDILLLLLVLAAIYLAAMLVRLTRVGRRYENREISPSSGDPVVTATPSRQRGVEPAIPPEAALEANGEAVAPRHVAVPSAPTFEWDQVKDLFGETTAETARPFPESPAAESSRQGGFGEALTEHLARSDMETEMQRMRDEMERMRREMEEMRAARSVSPQYAEATTLVQRGCTAQDVADHLGISLAEAELVYALSRGRQHIDEGEEYGADGESGGFDAFDGRRTG